MNYYCHLSFSFLLAPFFAVLLLTACPSISNAAELSFGEVGQGSVGSETAIEAYIDTERDTINAIEGSIVVPPTLKVREIRFEGSVVSLWITRPNTNEKGAVVFAGLIPGGYQGTPDKKEKGNLFTVVFEPTAAGTATLEFGNDTKVLLNDGEGSRAALTFASQRFVVVADDGGPRMVALAPDTMPPLTFIPQVIDGGPYGIEAQVLIFDAQDKESGIAGYEIAFSTIKTNDYESLHWEKATSPYALKEDKLSLYLYVRAVDMAGNYRVAALAPYHFSLVAFLSSWTWYILLGLVVLLLIYRHRRHIKKA